MREAVIYFYLSNQISGGIRVSISITLNKIVQLEQDLL